MFQQFRLKFLTITEIQGLPNDIHLSIFDRHSCLPIPDSPFNLIRYKQMLKFVWKMIRIVSDITGVASILFYISDNFSMRTNDLATF